MDYRLEQSLLSIVNTKLADENLPPLMALIALRKEEFAHWLPDLPDSTKADLCDLLERVYILGLQDGARPLGSLLQVDISTLSPTP
ncbi:hypothetical protein [Deinococcus cellulosilyticus]|uniref:Uncharacterized protein n=1 Tax=Deinococcus cellulosilyticus (strain DSM 18568 / NBRC 106333 / KACC 11606 / 5516J-15) TaxID=1223518 RepID=A0A511NB30_DEIC1|nr:hypothetical protein [Deinococcus cellulosilyticus]GEM50014.1 hypothetical protein DC3_56490 [Deinococcus cellulosilyticus NBRC 106333 = KACC 11606]